MANIYDMSDTWNDGGTTFTAIKMDVTDTASDASSLLMDLQVGGVSKFSVSKDGPVSINSNFGIGLNFNPDISNGRVTYIINGSSGAGGSFYIGGVGTKSTVGMATSYGSTTLRSAAYFGWASGATINTPSDVRLYRDAAGTLAQRNSTNAQTFNLYNTYTDASNYERASMYWSGDVFYIQPQKAGTGANREIRLQGSTGSSVRVRTDGGVLLNGGSGNLTVLTVETVINNTLRLSDSPAVANLPGTPVVGMISRVTDGDSGLTPGDTVVNSGAGATPYLVWYNGTNWTVIGA